MPDLSSLLDAPLDTLARWLAPSSGAMLALAAGLLAVVVATLAIRRGIALARAVAALFSGRAVTAGPLPGEMTRHLSPADREFLPAALELLETPPSPILVSGIWLIGTLTIAVLAWSYFGKLDIHAVATGRIQPSGRSKVIQPAEAGRVVAVHVDNGSKVKAGDVLVELDPTETTADRDAQTRELEASRAEAARRRVAIEIARGQDRTMPLAPIPFDKSIGPAVRKRETLVLDGDLSQLRSARSSQVAQLAERMATREKLIASIEARAKVIALAKERVDMRTTLNDQGALSRAMVIDVLAQYEQQMASQVADQGQLVETEAAIRTVQSKIEELVSQFIADQAVKLAEAERKADRLQQELVKATARSDRSTLKAPIAGTVQQLAITTVGQVVAAGQSVMTVVPSDGPIEIEAMIQNQDIGFVHAGQDAVVKVDAFPFTRYGTLAGKVARVSRDAVDERDAVAMSDPMAATKQSGVSTGGASSGRGPSLVFPATIRLERSTIEIDGTDIPLTSGMSVSVEILTGKRRAIDYVLSPLREVTSRSARER